MRSGRPGQAEYEVWQLPSPATPQVTAPTRVAGLRGRNLELVEHRVLRKLAQSGIRLGSGNGGRAKGAVVGRALSEDLALTLGLLFRCLAPMRNRENMRTVAEGIEAMQREEAAYWLGMAMHRKTPAQSAGGATDAADGTEEQERTNAGVVSHVHPRLPPRPLPLCGLPRHAPRRPPVRGQDALPPPAGRKALRLPDPPPGLRQILLALAAGELYDRNWASEFEQVFGGLDIGREPTENRHSFVVLRFDFSAVHDAPETSEREFEYYCGDVIRRSMERHPSLFPQQEVQRISSAPSASLKLIALFDYASRHDIRLFVLVDEYDSFATAMLARHGVHGHPRLAIGNGFYHSFFAALKSGAGRSGGLERVFITGATPLALEDAVSGFNIATHISFAPEFNALLGFTEAEVRDLVQAYRRAGALSLDEDAALDVMRQWYGGYRFAAGAEEEVYNTHMVLHFLNAAMPNKPMPDDLIDEDVRKDYGQLRRLLTEGRNGAARAMQVDAPSPHEDAGATWRPRGNFELLRLLVDESQMDAEIQASFTLERLERGENFLSLLYNFGLLSIQEGGVERTRLRISNLTACRQFYDLLRDVCSDIDVPYLNFPLARLLHGMAHDGDWCPVFDFLSRVIAEQIKKHGRLKDDGLLLSFLGAHLGLSGHFRVHEVFVDILLEPRVAPDHCHGYLIEIKHINDEKTGEDNVQAAVEKVERRLRHYLADERLSQLYPTVAFTGLAVVFCKSAMVHWQEIAR